MIYIFAHFVHLTLHTTFLNNCVKELMKLIISLWTCIIYYHQCDYYIFVCLNFNCNFNRNIYYYDNHIIIINTFTFNWINRYNLIASYLHYYILLVLYQTSLTFLFFLYQNSPQAGTKSFFWVGAFSFILMLFTLLKMFKFFILKKLFGFEVATGGLPRVLLLHVNWRKFIKISFYFRINIHWSGKLKMNMYGTFSMGKLMREWWYYIMS